MRSRQQSAFPNVLFDAKAFVEEFALGGRVPFNGRRDVGQRFLWAAVHETARVTVAAFLSAAGHKRRGAAVQIKRDKAVPAGGAQIDVFLALPWMLGLVVVSRWKKVHVHISFPRWP